MDDGAREEVESCISAVMTANPLRMTVRDLDRQFREAVGYAIPFRDLGYRDLESYLKSIPHRLHVLGHGYMAEVCVVVNEKTAHVHELVAHQRTTVPRHYKKSNFRRYSTVRQNNFFNHCNGSFVPNRRLEQIFPNPRQIPSTVSLTPISTSPKTPTSVSSKAPNSTSPKAPNSTSAKTNTSTSPKAPTLTSPKTNTLTSPKAPTSTSPKTNALTSPKTNTWTSPKTPSLTSPKTPTSTSPKTPPKHNSKGSSPLSSSGVVPKSAKEVPIPNFIQIRLQEIVSNQPDGVHCNKLPALYKKKFGQELRFSIYGYKSVAQICADLGSVFAMQRLKDSTYKVYDKALGLDVRDEPLDVGPDETRARQAPNTEPALPDDAEAILLAFHLSNLPPEVAGDADVVRQWVGEDVGVESYVDILISEVQDPSKFWVLLREHAVALDDLMDRMQEFYRANCISYAIPKYAIRQGMYLSCLFDGEYHRARVLDVSRKRDEGLIKVFYADYGTVATVDARGTCYLVEEFVELPAQAVRARLHGVRPRAADSMWPRPVANRFLGMVSNKALVGQIYALDEEEMILELVVTDTSNPDRDYFINDALVTEGLAAYVGEESQPPPDRDFEPTIANVYLYPSHEELEDGLAPNLQALLHIEASNYSCDWIYPKYFKKIEKDESEKSESQKSESERSESDEKTEPEKILPPSPDISESPEPEPIVPEDPPRVRPPPGIYFRPTENNPFNSQSMMNQYIQNLNHAGMFNFLTSYNYNYNQFYQHQPPPPYSPPPQHLQQYYPTFYPPQYPTPPITTIVHQMAPPPPYQITNSVTIQHVGVPMAPPGIAMAPSSVPMTPPSFSVPSQGMLFPSASSADITEMTEAIEDTPPVAYDLIDFSEPRERTESMNGVIAKESENVKVLVESLTTNCGDGFDAKRESRERRSYLTGVPGFNVHILALPTSNKKFLILKQLFKHLFKPIDSTTILRLIARSPYLVEIETIPCKVDSDLQLEMIAENLISRDDTKIDIIACEKLPNLIKTFRVYILDAQLCDKLVNALSLCLS